MQHLDVPVVNFATQALCRVLSDKVPGSLLKSLVENVCEYYWGTYILQVKIWADLNKSEGKHELRGLGRALQPIPGDDERATAM